MAEHGHAGEGGVGLHGGQSHCLGQGSDRRDLNRDKAACRIAGIQEGFTDDLGNADDLKATCE